MSPKNDSIAFTENFYLGSIVCIYEQGLAYHLWRFYSILGIVPNDNFDAL